MLTYPIKRHLSILSPHPTTLNLTEAPIPGDPFSETKNAVPPYLAFAASGNVTAEVVYVNYGRTEDYDKLRELGVDVKGAITLCRYGQIFRGDKVRRRYDSLKVSVCCMY